MGKDTPAWVEFFPRGLTELHQARDAEVLGILQRLVNAATTHVPEVQPSFATLLADWKAISGLAAEGRGAAAVSAQARDEAIAELKLQLTHNLLTLGLRYLGKPEMASVFFNTSLLYNRQSSGGAEESPGAASSGGDPEAAE